MGCALLFSLSLHYIAELKKTKSKDICASDIHLILIGHTNVGKTSLRKHLKNEPIDRNEPPTVVMESEYIRGAGLDSNVSVTMWNTGGHPFFQDLLPCFARFKCLLQYVMRNVNYHVICLSSVHRLNLCS